MIRRSRHIVFSVLMWICAMVPAIAQDSNIEWGAPGGGGGGGGGSSGSGNPDAGSIIGTGSAPHDTYWCGTNILCGATNAYYDSPSQAFIVGDYTNGDVNPAGLGVHWAEPAQKHAVLRLATARSLAHTGLAYVEFVTTDTSTIDSSIGISNAAYPSGGVNQAFRAGRMWLDSATGLSFVNEAGATGTFEWYNAGSAPANLVMSLNATQLLPGADNTVDIGSDALRFKLVRAVTITSGDLGLGFGPVFTGKVSANNSFVMTATTKIGTNYGGVESWVSNRSEPAGEVGGGSLVVARDDGMIDNVVSYQAGSKSGSFLARSAKGTLASPTATISGDVLGFYRFGGQIDTTVGNFWRSAEMRAEASQTFDNLHAGTDIVFASIQNNADPNSGPSEHMRVTNLGEVVPATDNTGSIGTGAKRWNLIRGVTITSGDIGFDDDVCAVCLLPFIEGDDIVMHAYRRVRPTDGKPYMLTVPIHADCRGGR